MEDVLGRLEYACLMQQHADPSRGGALNIPGDRMRRLLDRAQARVFLGDEEDRGRRDTPPTMQSGDDQLLGLGPLAAAPLHDQLGSFVLCELGVALEQR